jgi:hypothetical protein
MADAKLDMSLDQIISSNKKVSFQRPTLARPGRPQQGGLLSGLGGHASCSAAPSPGPHARRRSRVARVVVMTAPAAPKLQRAPARSRHARTWTHPPHAPPLRHPQAAPKAKKPQAPKVRRSARAPCRLERNRRQVGPALDRDAVRRPR